MAPHHGPGGRARRLPDQATGPANRPKLPQIPGIDRFKGHSFHTARWDYAYTGGDHQGDLHKLTDKRVGIIGTGATAIQCIPFLGSAQDLYVSAHYSVDLRATAKRIGSGMQGWRQAGSGSGGELAAVLAGQNFTVDLVADGWTGIARPSAFR